MRHRASEVPEDLIKSDAIRNLAKQMKKVLRNYNLVGLAAPQIGVPSRVIVMEAPEQLKKRYPKEIYDSRQMSVLPITVKTLIHITLARTKLNLSIFSGLTDIHQSSA